MSVKYQSKPPSDLRPPPPPPPPPSPAAVARARSVADAEAWHCPDTNELLQAILDVLVELKDELAPTDSADSPPNGTVLVSTFRMILRARKCLRAMGIQTVAQVRAVSDDEMLFQKNTGDATVNEIRRMTTGGADDYR